MHGSAVLNHCIPGCSGFFLPLHFHPASAVVSQVTHECACLHGSRTQVGAASVHITTYRLKRISFAGEVTPVQVSIRDRLSSMARRFRVPVRLFGQWRDASPLANR
jgi:hypothetical protein